LRQIILSLLLLGGVAPAAAQSPRVTAAGDPSVRSDTIYRLVVDPADHPEETFVYLLDDGILRYEADGRGSRTYRQVVQILDREAVEVWGEHTFGYSSSRERLTINWARVLGADGSVISEKPAHEQVFDAPVPESSPVFTDRKLHRISLSGVAPGTIVDYSYTVERLEPVMPGDFFSGWNVTTGLTTRRSRLILDVPASLEPRIRERNLGSPRQVRVTKGRRVYTWAAADLPMVELEPFAADSNEVHQNITIGGAVEWDDVVRWYNTLAADRYTLTPAIEAALTEILADATTRTDSLRAVHRWISQDFRYVSLSLGIGGYQPRTPAAVFETKSGDCKDKATFFIAIARRLGFRALPVLVSQGGGVLRGMPSALQFDHMIAAVEDADGYLYFDLTAGLTPFGEIPPSLQGEFGLILHGDGRGEEVTLPESERGANRNLVRIVGELSPAGLFRGRYEEAASGTMQYGLRSAFSANRSDKERDELQRNLAGSIITGARGDSLVIFNGRDLSAEPRVTLLLSDARLTRSAGTTEIMTIPLPNFTMDQLVTTLEAGGERRYPINVEAILGWHESTWEFHVTLPDGWRAELPGSVVAESEFGSYTAEYQQEGRELRILRRMAGAKGVQPPAASGALIDWLRAISADDVPYIALERPAVSTSSR
jgi:transglutaminase-like putative cysteine protease